MSDITYTQRTTFEAMILDLSDACPFDGTNPCTCPWHDMRDKSLAEKKHWIQALSDESVMQMLAFHKLCSKRPQASFAGVT